MLKPLHGLNIFGEPHEPPRANKLSTRFHVPPFTVLNAREGWWQQRKRAWIRLGIKSELGRDKAETYNSGKPGTLAKGFKKKTQHLPPGGGGGGCWLGGKRTETSDNFNGVTKGTSGDDSGTSIFDPVLCELVYRWFCPPSGVVLDPFAGGSVRGIVAHMLGRKYLGFDLSQTQIDANYVQAKSICPESQPTWICGDSKRLCNTHSIQADSLFSCPPYGDLEKYSDDPRDLSNMDYPQFLEAHRKIIEFACARLKPNRFACWVVGDFRDKEGHYRNFVSETIAAFQAAGLYLHNECILVTAVGSLPIRITKQFSNSRKLGKTHQQLLVFIKGDYKKATRRCWTAEERILMTTPENKEHSNPKRRKTNGS